MRKMRKRKYEYVPDSLVRHIDRIRKEINAETRIEAMEQIAKELDRIVIRRRKI